VGLTATIIVVVVLVVAALGSLGVVMSRPRQLRPHEPGGRGIIWRGRYRRRRRGGRPDDTSSASPPQRRAGD
jgi:hypothetical protein